MIDLSNVKQLTVPEGDVKSIKIENNTSSSWDWTFYTNLIDTSTTDPGGTEIYNTNGYKDGMRWSSSGKAPSSDTNGRLTGWIPYKAGTLRVQYMGVNKGGYTSGGYIVYYNKNGTVSATTLGKQSTDFYTTTLSENSNILYFRISGFKVSYTPIITINEEIVSTPTYNTIHSVLIETSTNNPLVAVKTESQYVATINNVKYLNIYQGATDITEEVTTINETSKDATINMTMPTSNIYILARGNDNFNPSQQCKITSICDNEWVSATPTTHYVTVGQSFSYQYFPEDLPEMFRCWIRAVTINGVDITRIVRDDAMISINIPCVIGDIEVYLTTYDRD